MPGASNLRLLGDCLLAFPTASLGLSFLRSSDSVIIQPSALQLPKFCCYVSSHVPCVLVPLYHFTNSSTAILVDFRREILIDFCRLLVVLNLCKEIHLILSNLSSKTLGK